MRARTLLSVAAVALLVPSVEAQSVSGRILDDASGAPIGGASVTLLTEDHRPRGSATSDARGRYRIDVDSAGTYLLLAETSGYSSLLSPPLRLVRGEVRTHDFRVATLTAASEPEPEEEPAMDAETLAQALAVVCDARLDSDSEGILVGVVRDSVSSLPLADVTTTLSWTDESGEVRTRELITGDDGAFVFCEAPAGSDRRLTAEVAGMVTRGQPFQVNAGMIKRQDLFLNLSANSRPGDILGRVVDFESEEPVAGAEVRLRGTRFQAMTGESGNFAFQDVPWGVYFLEVDHIAYEHQEQALRVMGDRAHDIEVRLATEPLELDPISVQVRSRNWFAGMRGFRERRSRGFGYHLDQEAIERRGAIRVVDLLREIPGVNVEMARSSSLEPGRTTTQAIYFRNCWRYTPQGDQVFTPPVLYVDGVKQVRLDLSRGDLDTVRPQDIAALEVYPGVSQVPAEFGGSDAGCGVIAIWTKRE